MFKVNNVNFEQVNVGWEDDMQLTYAVTQPPFTCSKSTMEE